MSTGVTKHYPHPLYRERPKSPLEDFRMDPIDLVGELNSSTSDISPPVEFRDDMAHSMKADTLSYVSDTPSKQREKAAKQTTFQKQSARKRPENVGTYDNKYVSGKAFIVKEMMPVPEYHPRSPSPVVPAPRKNPPPNKPPRSTSPKRSANVQTGNAPKEIVREVNVRIVSSQVQTAASPNVSQPQTDSHVAKAETKTGIVEKDTSDKDSESSSDEEATSRPTSENIAPMAAQIAAVVNSENVDDGSMTPRTRQKMSNSHERRKAAERPYTTAVKRSGSSAGTAGKPRSSTGSDNDPSEKKRDSRGNQRDSAEKTHDSMGNQRDSTRKEHESSGIQRDSSGNKRDSTKSASSVSSDGSSSSSGKRMTSSENLHDLFSDWSSSAPPLSQQEEYIYKKTVQGVLNPVGAADNRHGFKPTDLAVFVRKAFQVDPDTHERILQEAQNTKATNVILNVAVIEASDLKHASGAPNCYCTLGLIAAKSPNSSPSQSRKSRASKQPSGDVLRQCKQTTHVRASKEPKWNDGFELEVADMQTEDLQLGLYHQNLPADAKTDNKTKAGGKGFFKKKEKEGDFIGKCIVPLKGIPSAGHENWFTIYTDRTGKLETTGRVKLRLDFSIKQESEQSHWAESDQCTVEEFHYVTKAMYRYSVLATAQSAKSGDEDEDIKSTFQGLPNQLKTILHQFAVQNQFSKLTQILVEAVVVLELSADKFCPCDIPEKLLRESVVGLELQYTADKPLNEGSGSEAPLLSNVERALFDKAGAKYVKHLTASIKCEDLPRLFPAEELQGGRLDLLNKKVSMAVTVLNMQTWQNNERARKVAAQILSEQIQDGVREWVKEQLSWLDSQNGDGLDPVIPHVKAMTSIVSDSLALLRPMFNVSQYFTRLGVDYFKVVSMEMERKLSAKAIALMAEIDRYQMRYHRYASNIRESSKVSLHFYFALRKLFAAVRNNVGDRELYKVRDYQQWFENAAVFWLQTFREECIKRMEKALEIDKDVVQVTSQVKFSNSSVDVLSCFAIIAQEWNDIDFADADIGLLGCTKVTYTICDGATQYAGRIQNILETNGYYDFIDNAQFDVTDQLCITLNNIMHVHEYLAQLPALLRFDTVCEHMSVKHEDDTVGQKNRQMLANLVLSADRDMLLRADAMIHTITDKMAVDIEAFCKHFTRKEPAKKASLDPLLAYLQENMSVLEEKLEHQLYPMILEQLWRTLLTAVHSTLLKGKSPEYYKHQLEHVASMRDLIFADTQEGESSQLYSALMDQLHMLSLTSEELLLAYYGDVTKAKLPSTPAAYYGHLAVIVGYREAEGGLNIHAKVCSGQNLPGLLKDNTCNPFVAVTLMPHTEKGVSEQRVTNVVESSLGPTYNEEFVFEKQAKSCLSLEGACVVFSAWNHESLLPHDFLGELCIPLSDVDNMARVTSLDELRVRMMPLTRPEMPECGPFKYLQERAEHEKQAKSLVKQRCVMAGWQYPLQIGAPVFKVINQVMGKKTELRNSEYGLSSSTHGKEKQDEKGGESSDNEEEAIK